MINIIDLILHLFFNRGNPGTIEFHCDEEIADIHMVIQGQGVNYNYWKAMRANLSSLPKPVFKPPTYIKNPNASDLRPPKSPTYLSTEHIGFDDRSKYIVPVHLSNRMAAGRIDRAMMHRIFTKAILTGLRPIGFLVDHKLVHPNHNKVIDESVLWPPEELIVRHVNPKHGNGRTYYTAEDFRNSINQQQPAVS